MADQGHTVVGVDISSAALKTFFQEQNIEFTTQMRQEFTLFKVCVIFAHCFFYVDVADYLVKDCVLCAFQSNDEKIRLYAGDFFKFDR